MRAVLTCSELHGIETPDDQIEVVGCIYVFIFDEQQIMQLCQSVGPLCSNIDAVPKS